MVEECHYVNAANPGDVDFVNVGVVLFYKFEMFFCLCVADGKDEQPEGGEKGGVEIQDGVSGLGEVGEGESGKRKAEEGDMFPRDPSGHGQFEQETGKCNGRPAVGQHDVVQGLPIVPPRHGLHQVFHVGHSPIGEDPSQQNVDACAFVTSQV